MHAVRAQGMRRLRPKTQSYWHLCWESPSKWAKAVSPRTQTIPPPLALATATINPDPRYSLLLVIAQVAALNQVDMRALPCLKLAALVHGFTTIYKWAGVVQSVTQSLAHSLTHSLTRSLTHSLTH